MHRRARIKRSQNYWIKTTVELWNENTIIAFSALYDMLRTSRKGKKAAKEYLKRLRKTNKKLYVKVIKMFRIWDVDNGCELSVNRI